MANQCSVLVFFSLSQLVMATELPENGNFEIATPITSDGVFVVSTPIPDLGVWYGDPGEMVTAENGITPFEGDRMLVFLTGHGSESNILNFARTPPELRGTDVKLEAYFNATDFSPTHSIELVSHSDILEAGSSYPDFGPTVTEFVDVDDDLGTWESFELTMRIPRNSNSLQFRLNGANNDDALVYVDAVRLTPFLLGDFNSDDQLNVLDIDGLTALIAAGFQSDDFDLNDDGAVNVDDVIVWVKDLRNTYTGDANLDGEFNSRDLVEVFQYGEFEDDFPLNSTWQSGDWNADGDFTSSDFVFAFQDGGYERGPRVAMAVPESSGTLVFTIAICAIAILGRVHPRSYRNLKR